MEVQPAIYIDPSTGEEIISYEHAQVIDHSYRDDVQREHRALEQQAIYEDENGIHSVFADAIDEGERRAEESQYEAEDEYEEEDQELSFDEFADGIYDQLEGGQQGYQVLTNWAAQNWAEYDIEQFDSIMDSGDYALMTQAINYLYQQYIENNWLKWLLKNNSECHWKNWKLLM